MTLHGLDSRARFRHRACMKQAVVGVASLVLWACGGAAGPDGVKAVNVGFPSSRGLGALGVDPGGRVFLRVSQDVWELTGSLEADTQVWKQQDAFAGQDVSWGVPGYGAVAHDGQQWKSLSRPDAEPLPYLVAPTVFTPLLVEPDGTALAVGRDSLSAALLYRRAPQGAWTPLDGTGQPYTTFTSALRLDDGRVFAFHGSRVFELPPGLASATVAWDCDTRALGSCGASASIQSFARKLPDGRLVFLARNPQVEVYAFKPGDAELTRLARLGTAPVNGQVYGGSTQGLGVDGAGNVYLAVRTEQTGGEVHLLGHRPGAGEDDWVTAVTGLPRVVTFLGDDAGTLWLWDGSDSFTGLWKVMAKSARCKVCGEG